MPSERFYRLTEEKKKTIIDAARKEFARVSFEKASINKIVEHANISRGSFYTYFEDKSDVVKYIIEEHKQEIIESSIVLLKNNQGDLFQVFERSFEQAIAKFDAEKEIRDMMFHIFEYHRNRSRISPFESKEGYAILEVLYPYVNQEQWKEKNIETVGVLLSLSGMVLWSTLMNYHYDPEAIDDIRLVYYKKINVLRYGMLYNE